MNEMNQAENINSQESSEDQLFLEVQQALEEENRLWSQIKDIFKYKSREEAEKIVLETYAEEMDLAIKKLSEASEKWQEALRKGGGLVEQE